MRRIMYVQYTKPAAYPPLEHSARVLAGAGWEVLFLGITKHGDPRLDWAATDGISVRELPPSGPGWWRKMHYAWFAVWVLSWILRWRPACVYASDALACPVILPVSFWPNVHIVYHEHDAPQVHGRGIVPRLVLWTRRRLAERAEARVLPNEPRVEQFARAITNHRPTFSVWNCPSRTEVTPPRDPHEGPGLRLLYVGSIVPFRLPTTILAALAMLPAEVHLRLIGYASPGYSDYVADLTAMAQLMGVGHRIDVIDGMPHADLLLKSREADVGLVLMPAIADDESEQWMPGASNKPFDYLASGLALLVSDVPAWRRLFVEPGYGLACTPEDPHSIAAALNWLIDHPVEMRAMGERGRQRIAAEWNYETQFRPVQEWLDENCHSRPRSI
ncbi:MAG: glycosyltransferase [Chloroflexota bacterium]|nr:glycosyltransferase [Chloroflexota bacterium]